MALGGADAIVFTGGIGENGVGIRQSVCQGLDDLGIRLSPTNNAGGPIERRIDDSQGKVQIWIVPTNEELIVARQTVAAIQS
jgi:acetate kinase